MRLRRSGLRKSYLRQSVLSRMANRFSWMMGKLPLLKISLILGITKDDEVKNEVAVKLGKVSLAAHDSQELVSHAQYDLQIWGTTPFCPVLPCIKCPLYSCSL